MMFGGEIASNLSLKVFARSMFPDTYRLLWLIKNHFIKNPNEPHNIRICSDIEPQDIALSFLQNQNAMNELSTARNARHVLVLQPHMSLIDSRAVDHTFRNSVYDLVMASDFCKKNVCIDARATQIPMEIDDLYNGTNIETAVFADNVHLTDNGVLLFSQMLIDRLPDLFSIQN